MAIGKALAMTAITGMLAALTTGCASGPDPKVPSTDVPDPADKDCCRGRNECRNLSGCKTETNASCAGQNECKTKGTSCPKA